MAATQEGLAGIYNIDGTLAYTGVLKTVNILKSFAMTQTAREAQLERQGHIVGRASDLGKRSISWTIVPYDPTTPDSTLSAAKANVVAPPKFGDLTIDDFDITLFDGTWTITGDVTFTPKEGDYLEISGTAEQYLKADATYGPISALG